MHLCKGWKVLLSILVGVSISQISAAASDPDAAVKSALSSLFQAPAGAAVGGSANSSNLFSGMGLSNGTQAAQQPVTKQEISAQKSAASYQPSAEVSNSVKESFREVLSQNLPGKEAEIASRMQGVDIAARYQPVLDSVGYPASNVTSALAAMISTSYSIINDTDTSPQQDAKLWSQLDQAFSSQGAFTSFTDEQKQTLAETLYWSIEILAGQFMEAKNTNSPEALQQAKDATKEFLRRFGIDGNRLKIDDSGAHI